MKKILLQFAFALCSISAFGQIGINTSSPDKNSMLDITSSNKGLLIPRVNLTATSQDLNGDGDNNIANQPAGLMVYNTGSTFSKGFYYWNGSEWRNVNNSTTVAPSIGALNCSAATASPSTFTSGVAYTGTLSVPYTDGNGGSYPAGTTFTQNGLNFTLQAGTLALGAGNLIYTVSGSPDFSSPSTASIPISFLGKSCSATIGNNAVVKSISFVSSTSSPIDANTPINSQVSIGTITCRINATSSTGQGVVQFKLAQPSYYSLKVWLYGNNYQNTASTTDYGEHRWNTVAANTWVNLPGYYFTFSHYDLQTAIIMIPNTKEVFRITINVNGDKAASAPYPALVSQGTIFIEKLQ